MEKFILLTVVWVSLCFGSGRFILDAELRTNFAENGSTTQFMTGYTYDADGNRVQSRVWNGADSAATPMSAVRFSHDSYGAVTEALQLAGTDTLSIVRYAYAGGKLQAVRTLAKDGTLRYTDSLVYDGQARNVEEQRISSAGVKTYFHRYTLNASGKTIADSLYELVSGTYVASQAVLFTYNTDSTVATEVQWRMSSGTWYCISTAFMAYAAGSLVSVATHERDGVGTGMTDSLAYTCDANGNRTREDDYNGTKVLTHRIVYTWRDTQTTMALTGDISRRDRQPVLSSRQGRLTVDLSSQGRGMITIYDMTGRRLDRIAVDRSGNVPLAGVIGKGQFIAVFSTGKTNKQVMNFSHFN